MNTNDNIITFKPSIFTLIKGNFIFSLGLLIFVVAAEILKNTTFTILTLGFTLVVYYFSGLGRIKFLINKDGIITNDKILYKWNDIKYAYFIYGTDRTGTHKILKIHTQTKMESYDISGVSIKMNEFCEIVQKMSGRNIGACYHPELDKMIDLQTHENGLSQKEIEEKRQHALTYLPMFNSLYERRMVHPLPIKGLQILYFILLMTAFFAVLPRDLNNSLLLISLLNYSALMLFILSSCLSPFCIADVYNFLLESLFKKDPKIRALDKTEYAMYKRMTNNLSEPDVSDFIIIAAGFAIPLMILTYFFIIHE